MFFLLMACTDSGEDSSPTCSGECADYYTVRAIEDYYNAIWSTALSDIPNPYKDIEVPCIDGTTVANGSVEALKSGGFELDLTLDHDGCKTSDLEDGGGYELTLDGVVNWTGDWDSTGTIQNFVYQSSEITYSGTVAQEIVATEVEGTCTMQVSMTSTSTSDFTFAGTLCSRDLVNPGG